MEPADFAHFADTAAQQFLKELPPLIRERGEAYLQEGRVRDLRCDEPGSTFTADVEGGTLYQTTLRYDPESRSWWEECSCPMGGGCKHAYAAMKALLVEHSTARVRSLSEGAKPRPSVPAPTSRATPAGSFADKVTAALGRAPKPDETKFLRKLGETYRQCLESRRITRWDFEQLGLSLGGYGWDALHIWPAFPENEHEFWLYVANAAAEHGREIPEFLTPVTDLGVIADRLARWRRGREVDRWKQLLTRVRDWQSAAAPAGRGDFEFPIRPVLRLCPVT